MNSKLPHNHVDTRQERREEKLKKKREHIAQHGKALAKIYKDAVEKRTRKQA